MSTAVYPPRKMPLVRPVPINSKTSWFKRIASVFIGKRFWLLEENYYLYVPSLGGYVFIPKGFISDFASIPKCFWLIMSPTGILLMGSLPHDFGYQYGVLLVCYTEKSTVYQEHTVTKAMLDSLLAELATLTCGVSLPGWTAKTLLTLGGWLAWNKYRKKNKNTKADFVHLDILKENL